MVPAERDIVMKERLKNWLFFILVNLVLFGAFVAILFVPIYHLERKPAKELGELFAQNQQKMLIIDSEGQSGQPRSFFIVKSQDGFSVWFYKSGEEPIKMTKDYKKKLQFGEKVRESSAVSVKLPEGYPYQDILLYPPY